MPKQVQPVSDFLTLAVAQRTVRAMTKINVDNIFEEFAHQTEFAEKVSALHAQATCQLMTIENQLDAAKANKWIEKSQLIPKPNDTLIKHLVTVDEDVAALTSLLPDAQATKNYLGSQDKNILNRENVLTQMRKWIDNESE